MVFLFSKFKWSMSIPTIIVTSSLSVRDRLSTLDQTLQLLGSQEANHQVNSIPSSIREDTRKTTTEVLIPLGLKFPSAEIFPRVCLAYYDPVYLQPEVAR